jgi:RNA polymerase sigma-70 factor (ECF subfamily)
MDDAALDAALSALCRRAAEAYPEIVIARDRAEAGVVARLGAAASAATVDALHHDVVVAIAALAGDAKAVAVIEGLCTLEVTFAAGRLRATPTQADDVRSELRRLVFTADGERPAGLATYTGRGDFRGYARVIAARALARRMQRDQREETLDGEVIERLGSSIDPEVAMLRERYRPDVDAAFRAALGALSERARAVLRYSLVDGWSIDKIGTSYGVHRATAARWVEAAREELGRGIRAELARRLTIAESQVDSIVQLVTSRIEVSLDKLLI